MTLVRESMTSPAVALPSSASTRDALSLIERSKISALPVVDEGKLVGIVSTTDLVRDLALAPASEVRTLSTVMKTEVVTVGPDDAVELAARRMLDARVHRVVVVEGPTVIGVLSTRDLLATVVAKKSTAPLSALMTSDVVTIEIDAPLDRALEALVAAKVHGLVVVDGEHPLGVFTHAEALASRALPAALRSRPVEEVMSYETICHDLGTPAYRAAAQCIQMNVRRILVVDHRRLVGVLSVLDLLRVLIEPSA